MENVRACNQCSFLLINCFAVMKNDRGHALPSKSYCKLLNLLTRKEKGEQKKEMRKGWTRKKSREVKRNFKIVPFNNYKVTKVMSPEKRDRAWHVYNLTVIICSFDCFFITSLKNLLCSMTSYFIDHNEATLGKPCLMTVPIFYPFSFPFLSFDKCSENAFSAPNFLFIVWIRADCILTLKNTKNWGADLAKVILT